MIKKYKRKKQNITQRNLKIKIKGTCISKINKKI